MFMSNVLIIVEMYDVLKITHMEALLEPEVVNFISTVTLELEKKNDSKH